MKGHNSKPRGEAINAGQLRSFVERVERLREEVAALNEDVKEVYAEAKGEGYDVKIMKLVIGRRAKDPSALEEQDALVGVYLDALGTDGALRVQAQA